MKEKLGINVFAFSCEGYKGVSQSAGHHIANNQLFKHVIGRERHGGRDGKFNDQHAGRIQHRRRRLRDRGPASSAAASPWCPPSAATRAIDEFENAHTADLNLRHVPPLDQLRGRHDGEEVRHPLDQGELHRRRGHGQVAAQDRPVLRRRRADRARSRRSSPRRWPRCEPVAATIRAALRGQDGHALRRRQPGPPLPGPVRRASA